MYPKFDSTLLMLHPWLMGVLESTDKLKKTDGEGATATNPDTGYQKLEPNYRVRRLDGEVLLDIELPGVAKQDVTIEIQNRLLMICGNRYEEMTKSKFFHKSVISDEGHVGNTLDGGGGDPSNDDAECVDGRKPWLSYVLSLRVGHEADLDRIACVSCYDGVLCVRIPNVVQQTVRKIGVV